MKENVRRNFDASVRAYEGYEDRTGRFRALADRLYEAMAGRAAGEIGTILDAGAGSGASVRAFEERGGRPVALDLSRGMLRRCGTDRRVQGDFDRLPFRAGSFDAVAFTASLFLTPAPERAVAEARRVLRDGGVVGAVAPLGWTTPDGRDVFADVEREGRSPTSTEAVEAALRSEFDVATGTWTFETTGEDIRSFHAVPAMAARLYPRLDPEPRVRKARELLADLEGPARQRWRWMVGN